MFRIILFDSPQKPPGKPSRLGAIWKYLSVWGLSDPEVPNACFTGMGTVVRFISKSVDRVS